MTPVARTLSLRLAPLPGEALGSWLDAYAHRMQAPLGDLAVALGLPIAREGRSSRQLPYAPDWTIYLRESETASVSAASGISAAAIEAMTLTRGGARLDPRHRTGPSSCAPARSTPSPLPARSLPMRSRRSH